MRKGRQTVLVGTVLEEKETGVFVDEWVLGLQSNVLLEVEKGFVRVSLHLQTFGSLEVGLSE